MPREAIMDDEDGPSIPIREDDEPIALVDRLLLFRQPASCRDQPEPGGEEDVATLLASISGVAEQDDQGASFAKMVEALPRLYDFGHRTSIRGGNERFFIPLTLTDEVAQNWFAYSLVIDRADGQPAIILVALSKLPRCLTAMCRLLNLIVDTCGRSPSEAALLMHFVVQFLPYPLPGSSYRLMHSSGAMHVAMDFANPRDSNLLPSSTEAHYYKLIQVLGLDALFRVWIAALLEQRILLVTSKEGPAAACYLATCAEFLTLLLKPAKWQGIFVPFVPNTMSVLVEAPTPYILGIQEAGCKDAELDDDIVLVNVDSGHASLPASLPAVPESFESKLNAVDASMHDDYARGFNPESGYVHYSVNSLKEHVSRVRQCFASILVDLLSATLDLYAQARLGSEANPNANPNAKAAKRVGVGVGVGVGS